MGIPWIRLINAAIGLATIARRSGRPLISLDAGTNRGGDRSEVESRQLELERERAERALRLELVRQAGDRELSRLRLLAGLSLTSWIGSLIFATPLVDASGAGRSALGVGWVLLLAALAAAFAAHIGTIRAINRLVIEIEDRGGRPEPPSSGVAGTLAPWLIVSGLAVIAIGILVT